MTRRRPVRQVHGLLFGPMAMSLWTTAALVVWIVLWALGSKSFDAFMLTVLIVLIGATVHILKKYKPSRSNSL